MKSLTTTVIASLIVLLSFSQEDFSKEFRNEFGGHAGSTTGVGFAYRHWFENKFGIQITGIPIKSDDLTYISTGATGLYSLKETKYIRAYLYLGTHYWYSKDTYIDYGYYPNYYETNVIEYSNSFNIGFGPGFTFGRVVAFNLMVGYGAYDILGSFNLLPAGEMGLCYRF